MKKLSLLTVIACLAMFIYSCKAKKGGTEVSLAPGDAELKAIQVKFPDATAQTLSEGYGVYTGACTNCHGKKNMLKHTEEDWKKDIDRMSPRAKITDAQKDALWKYVLSIRAARGTAK